MPAAISAPLGATAMLIPVALFISAARTGPYRLSRNPIYLAFSLLQLGVACWVDSLWLVITLIPAVALMSFVVIPREERYLQLRFPTAYLPYQQAVRRWL